jgi:hypothetical protein
VQHSGQGEFTPPDLPGDRRRVLNLLYFRSANNSFTPMFLSQLQPGQRIRVIQQFQTFDKNRIEAGDEFTFCSYQYFPYDDGFTFQFEEGIIRLSGNNPDNCLVLANFSAYFELLSDI